MACAGALQLVRIPDRDAAVSPLTILLVVVLVFVIAGAGFGYRAPWGGPYYGYGGGVVGPVDDNAPA